MKTLCTVICPLFDSCLCFYFLHVRVFAALMSYRMGDFQDSYTLASKALKLHTQHVDSKELQAMLQKTFLNS